MYVCILFILGLDNTMRFQEVFCSDLTFYTPTVIGISILPTNSPFNHNKVMKIKEMIVK